MNKIKIVVMSLLILICCGCAKDATIMRINSDKSMSLEVDFGYSIESGKIVNINDVKAKMNSKGFFIDSYHDNKFNGLKLTKKYDNINKLSSSDEINVDLADILTGNFDDSKLFTIKRGILKNTYTANFNFDFKKLYEYHRKVYVVGAIDSQEVNDYYNTLDEFIHNVNIDFIINKLDINENYNKLNELNLLKTDGAYIIYGNNIYTNENLYELKNNMISNIQYTDVFDENFKDDYDLSYMVYLPSKAIKNNASINEGNVYKWNLSYFDNNYINYSFEMVNTTAIVVIVIFFILLFIGILVGLYLYRRYDLDRRKFINNNTNISSIKPQIDDSNAIESVNDLINM